MMRPYMKIALFLALPIVGALTLTGCRGGFHHGTPEKRAEWVTQKIAGELDLNDSQKAKLATVKDQMLADRAEMKKQREQVFETVLAQVRADKLDTAKLKGLMEEKMNNFRQKSDRTLELVAEFHASLTPEQKEKAAKHLEKMKERLENR